MLNAEESTFSTILWYRSDWNDIQTSESVCQWREKMAREKGRKIFFGDKDVER